MTPALEVRGLHKSFGDIQALAGVDLMVEPGQMVGFLGSNGAGKTTTMRSIIGLTSVDRGEVLWNGRPIEVHDRRNVGYMPQERGLYARMRVQEHIAYFGRLAGVDAAVAERRADQWCERVGLADRRHDLIQELSTGNAQRVQLAVALVHEPDLFLFDEPFAGLDPVAVSMLSSIMTEQLQRGAAVVFSSHQLELVQGLSEDVTIIAGGRTRASGRVSELRQHAGHRILSIQWDGQDPGWRPPDGEVLEAPTGHSMFRVPAAADGAALIAAADRAGNVLAVSFEPPGLEEVFLELVES